MGALELIISVATGAVGSILAVEFILSVEPICKFLVRRAARRLPVDHREHYESEWLQVVKDIKSPTFKLLHSVSLCLQARSIAGTLGAPVSNRIMSALVRARDILVAGLGLIILAPLLTIIAIAIKIDSPGPVLFRTRRKGKGGQPFGMFTFRTMSRSDGANRVTRVGVILRRLSMDNLPLLINLLRDEISLQSPLAADKYPEVAPPTESEN
jgi:hypothetical protein